MKRITRKGVATLAIAVLLLLPAVSQAQFGFGGIVYDPTNYANAVLRYNQLVRQLAQLRQTYQQVLNQYNLALQMSKSLENMPARYRAAFSPWRSFTATDLYGNTSGWVGAVNGAGAQTVGPAYQQATVPLLTYSQADSKCHQSNGCTESQIRLCVLGANGRRKCVWPGDRRQHPSERRDRAAADFESRTRLAFGRPFAQ